MLEKVLSDTLDFKVDVIEDGMEATISIVADHCAVEFSDALIEKLSVAQVAHAVKVFANDNNAIEVKTMNHSKVMLHMFAYSNPLYERAPLPDDARAERIAAQRIIDNTHKMCEQAIKFQEGVHALTPAQAKVLKMISRIDVPHRDVALSKVYKKKVPVLIGG